MNGGAMRDAFVFTLGLACGVALSAAAVLVASAVAAPEGDRE